MIQRDGGDGGHPVDSGYRPGEDQDDEGIMPSDDVVMGEGSGGRLRTHCGLLLLNHGGSKSIP